MRGLIVVALAVWTICGPGPDSALEAQAAGDCVTAHARKTGRAIEELIAIQR